MEYQQEKYVVIPQGQLMDEAKASLEGRWGLGAAAFLISVIISVVGELTGLGIVMFIIGGPLAVGMAMFFLRISRDQDVELEIIFEGFKMFGKALGAYVLMMIGIFIGIILLIIPGIMLAFGLSQTFYILADDPDMDIMDALKFSWELMDGHKFDLFVLGLRFIGWAILCIFTLGIGFFFLAPYYQTTAAKFYNSIRYGEHHYGPNNQQDDIMNHLVD